MRPAFFPLAPRTARARKASGAKFVKETLGIAAKGIGQVNDSARRKMVGEEGTEGLVALGVVDELGAENNIEPATERASREIELDRPNIGETVSQRALADEGERRRLAIDERYVSAERASDETGKAEPAADVENASPGKASSLGQFTRQSTRADPEMGPVGRLGHDVFAEKRLSIDELFEPRHLIESDRKAGVLELDESGRISGDVAEGGVAVRLLVHSDGLPGTGRFHGSVFANRQATGN